MLTKLIQVIGGLITGASLIFTVFIAKETISNSFHGSIPWYWIVLTFVSGSIGFGLFKYRSLVSRKIITVSRLISIRFRADEDKIQEEIRKRVLELEKTRRHQSRKSEETRATLDALEEIVDIPREEMENIARKVRDEYKSSIKEKQSTKKSKHKKPIFKKKFPLLWLAIGTAFLTLSLLRRGSSWYLISGCVLIILVIKMFKEYFTE